MKIKFIFKQSNRERVETEITSRTITYFVYKKTTINNKSKKAVK